MSNTGANQNFCHAELWNLIVMVEQQREINLEMNEVLRGWAEKSVNPTTLSSLYIFKIYFRPTLN